MSSPPLSILAKIAHYIPITRSSYAVLSLILGWYFCSISLSLYNKWMLDPKYGLKLPYPLFITSVHQFFLWIISFIYVRVSKAKKLKKQRRLSQRLAASSAMGESLSDMHLQSTPQVITTDKRQKLVYYIKFIVPTAVASAGDIGFGNLSFKYVPLTIYTVIKSSSIAFVLLFGCMFRLEKYHWKLGIVVGVMFVGVVCMAFKPSSASDSGDDDESAWTFIFGVICVVLSACLSGLRWVYTQMVLKKKDAAAQAAVEGAEEGIPGSIKSRNTEDFPLSDVLSSPVQGNGLRTQFSGASRETGITQKSQLKKKKKKKKKNPIHTINQLAPIMGITLLLASFIFERPSFEIIFYKLFTFNTGDFNVKHFFMGISFILFPGIQVFFMTICEFGILQRSKVLTLSIAGIFKELITIWVSMLILHERIKSFINWLGMVIIMLDVCYYNWYRYMEKQRIEREEKEEEEQKRTNDLTTMAVNSATGSTYASHPPDYQTLFDLDQEEDEEDEDDEEEDDELDDSHQDILNRGNTKN
ncbi:hypothetical protein ACO0QE_000680 [Hanseniaspora vineae]